MADVRLAWYLPYTVAFREDQAIRQISSAAYAEDLIGEDFFFRVLLRN